MAAKQLKQLLAIRHCMPLISANNQGVTNIQMSPKVALQASAPVP